MGVETTPTCMGSVDFFHYENGTLNAIGWALIRHSRLWNSQRIAFLSGNTEASGGFLYYDLRTDVANAIGNPDAEVPDFLFLATVLARQRLLFSWNTEPQRIPGDSYIGKIPGTRDQKELLVYAYRRSEEYRKSPPFQTRHVRSARKAYPQSIYQQKVDGIVPFTTDWSILCSVFRN